MLRSVPLSRANPGTPPGRLNALIFAAPQPALFFSVFYAVWEPAPARLAYANGGHNPPLLLERNKSPRLLDRHGMVLGVEEGLKYQTHIHELSPGTLLLCYTDGVTEAMDASGDMFGMDHLERTVLALDDWQPADVTRAVSEAVSEFTGDDDPSDDLTMVAVRRLA